MIQPTLARRILAVTAGFLAVVVLSTATDQVLHATGVYPPPGQRMSDGLFALALAYRIVFTVLGGWITVRMAPDRPMAHAWVLAGIGLVAGCAGAAFALSHPELGPAWYAIAIAATGAPCVWLGARIAMSGRRTPTPAVGP